MARSAGFALFTWPVAECKKAALTIKSATGIKIFQDEKDYGPWFNQLFGLVKTRDSCQPELAVEPSADTPSPQADSPEGSASVNSNEELYLPRNRSGKKRKNDEALHEILGVVKTMLENDPMKDYIQFAREEAAAARQHEMRMMQSSWLCSSLNYYSNHSSNHSSNNCTTCRPLM